jgi:ankyrin repeat protein
MWRVPVAGGTPVNGRNLEELRKRFSDLLNYDEENVLAPIDPLHYRTPEGDTCLHIAATRGDVRAIQLLLEAGADINTIGDMGSTALHNAVSQGRVEAVKYLLNAGASKQIKDEFGQTPEDRARQLGLEEIVSLFRARL